MYELLAQSASDDPRDYLARIWTDMQPFVDRQAGYIAGTVAVVIALIVLYAVSRRLAPLLSRRKELARVFQGLAAANKLSEGEIALLRAVSDHLALENPSVLFVQPSSFKRFRTEVARPGTPGGDALAAALTSLGEKLHGETGSR